MERLNGDRFITDSTMRLRLERDLIEQLKSDCREVNRLNEKVRKGQASKEEKEDMLRLESWIKEEARHLREIEGEEIETIICAEMKEIKRPCRRIRMSNK